MGSTRDALSGLAGEVRSKLGLSGGLTIGAMRAALAALGQADAESFVAVPSSWTWADSTWEEVAAMLALHYAGAIDVHDHWSVGDARTVRVSGIAPAAVDGVDVDNGFDEAEVEVVLMSADHYGMTAAQKRALGTSRDAAAFVCGTKVVLPGLAIMNGESTNVGGWDACARRAWCNAAFPPALPEGLRPLLKQVEVVTSVGSAYGTVPVTSEDRVFLPSLKEVFGDTDDGGSYYLASSTAEATLSQYEWYEAGENRVKRQPDLRAASWWLRSPRFDWDENYCYVKSDGTRSSCPAASWQNRLSPHWCI